MIDVVDDVGFEADEIEEYRKYYGRLVLKYHNTKRCTGDYSNLALWLAILCAGGVGVLGTTVYIKRRRRME